MMLSVAAKLFPQPFHLVPVIAKATLDRLS